MLGRCVMNWRTPSADVDAVPTRRMSGWWAMTAPMPSRNKGWSSTHRMVIASAACAPAPVASELFVMSSKPQTALYLTKHCASCPTECI